jgi:hypothetical protein
MFRATTAALVGVAAGNECLAENFNLVSQTNEGTVTTSVAGIKLAQPFMEKVDFEKFNVRGESTLTLKTPMGKQELTQKHILSIERKRFVSFLEAKGTLTGDHSKCVKFSLPPQLPEPEVFADLFKKFSALLECKETDGAIDTWRTSASFKHLSAELEMGTSPDSLLHWANENVTITDVPVIGSLPVHADLIVTTAAVGGPEEADLDETQFGDCEEIPMPWDYTAIFTDYPGFWTKNILAVVQQMQESVVEEEIEEESDEMLGGKINLAISDCGDAATHGHVSGISPTFVTKGKKSVVTGTGHLDTTVTDGSFDFDIKFGDMSVHKCTGDICSSSKCSFPMGMGSIVYHGLNCPMAEGDVTMDFDVRVSRMVPKEFETLTIELQSKGSAGDLLCAKIATSPGTMDEEISV